ncbi:hypothetical protein F4821DRAFT_215902 [Hypoxylon rubiginosum]|uniref:Uncharacterized protein n=1 Tax=Hypoxylon rubiginosum TaxID=110542 RepID=A0ACC0CPT7_9PEZI|nr:hypothetical protein F4821DRAFT_215902 [Hypoxylon rubiginosum]
MHLANMRKESLHHNFFWMAVIETDPHYRRASQVCFDSLLVSPTALNPYIVPSRCWARWQGEIRFASLRHLFAITFR